MQQLSRAEAAEIARRHGLPLSDAAALHQLADTPEEADAIASRFANGKRDNAFVESLTHAVTRNHHRDLPLTATAADVAAQLGFGTTTEA